MAFGYPILLDLTGRIVVIIGGGAVAARKARGVMAAGAGTVRCVAPSFCADLPAQVERIAEEFRPAHLDGAGLVFAATDSPAVNECVVAEARRRGILANRADVDEDEPGDFIVPAIWRGGAVTLAVSAGGSPALAAKIRDDLGKGVDPTKAAMADAMLVLRPAIRAAALSPQQRRKLLQDLASDEALTALRDCGIQGLREWIGQRFPGWESAR